MTSSWRAVDCVPYLTLHFRGFALKMRTHEATRPYQRNRMFPGRDGFAEASAQFVRATVIMRWRAALLAAAPPATWTVAPWGRLARGHLGRSDRR